MDSTTTVSTAQTGPGSFSEVLGSFVVGDRSLAELRELFCDRLMADPTCGAEMQSALEKELQAERITVDQYKELVEGINNFVESVLVVTSANLATV